MPEKAKKILLVEDEAILALSEAKLLERHGYEVSTAYTGEKAVAAVESESDIDLVLMDIDLGKGMDGTEAAQKILETHDLPIAFLSSHTEPEIVERTEGLTSYGYIVKNSGETVLLASIRMAFRLYDAHMELKRQKESLREALIKQEQTEEELIEQNVKFRTLVEQNIDMLFLHDLEGKILDANKVGEKLTGYSREELLSMSIPDLDPDYFEREDGGHFWQQMSFNEPFKFQARLRRKDGSIFIAEIVLSKVVLNGKTVIMTLSRDITDRLEADEALKEKLIAFHQLFESMNEGVAIYKPVNNGEDFEIVDINRAGQRIGNVSKEEVIGKHVTEVFPGITKIGLLDVLRNVNETGESRSHPLVLYEDERITFWAENKVFRLPSGYVCAIFEDNNHADT
ncbi:MAG: PAS domain S-box protein [Spirochaetales bacterium]|nr:PAS domain S-box protein [Spirochaetales bacterium]MCF7938789.1 PAS domain S-box protein [Spirochaetales bacterium]